MKKQGGEILRMLREAKPIHIWLAAAMLLNLIVVATAILTPELLGDIVQQMYDFWDGTFTGQSLTEVLLPLCIQMAVLYVIRYGVSYLEAYLMNVKVSRFYTAGLRIRLSDKVQRLSVKFMDAMPVGQFVEHMNDDVGNIGFYLHTLVNTVTMGFLQLTAVIIVMFSDDWRMALAVIILMPASLWLSAKLSKRSEKQFDRMFELYGDHNNVVEESYSNYQTVKAYNLENSRMAAHARVNDELAGAEWKADVLASSVSPIIAFTNEISYILIAVLGAFLIVKGHATVGSVVTAVFFANQFSSPLEQIASGLSQVQRIRASAKRVFGILDEPEEEQLPEKLPEEVRGAITLSHVDFAYDPEVPLISDLSIDVKPGQKVAIVGPTGAGKTTLVNLLMRFYDIQAGTITVDGQDIAQVDRDDIRARFGMVLQDTWLFKGTVAENVAYGRPDATREEIEHVCDEAYCDHFIRTFPHGYDTVIGEDTVSLSGGQKQLLTIARALLCDREFLILDEATSNVDTRTEVLIQKAMNKLMEGRTCFIIAHRLSTIVDADVILVMDHGRIVERGTHGELLAKQGFYWEMFNSQAK